jgi:uridine kinase
MQTLPVAIFLFSISVFINLSIISASQPDTDESSRQTRNAMYTKNDISTNSKFVSLTNIEMERFAPFAERIVASRDGSNRPLVIGIAGGTASGKTTMSRAIYEAVGPEHISYITHDCYYHDLSHLTHEERDAWNYDHPNALDTPLLIEHLILLREMKPVRIPTYDYKTHTRFPGEEELLPRPIILVEGILIFSEPRLVELMDIKIFVDTEDDIRLARRLQRDTIERERSVENVLTQYLKTVRPMHKQFVEPSKRMADIIVPDGGMNSVALDLVVSKLKYSLGASFKEESTCCSTET